MSACALGLWLCALNVRYRDVRYVIPFVVQFGIFISPVGFSSSLVRDKYGETVFMLYSLNPMVGVIEGVRWSLFGDGSPPDAFAVAVAPAVIAALFASGAWYFWKTERTFADII